MDNEAKHQSVQEMPGRIYVVREKNSQGIDAFVP